MHREKKNTKIYLKRISKGNEKKHAGIKRVLLQEKNQRQGKIDGGSERGEGAV